MASEVIEIQDTLHYIERMEIHHASRNQWLQSSQRFEGNMSENVSMTINGNKNFWSKWFSSNTFWHQYEIQTLKLRAVLCMWDNFIENYQPYYWIFTYCLIMWKAKRGKWKSSVVLSNQIKYSPLEIICKIVSEQIVACDIFFQKFQLNFNKLSGMIDYHTSFRLRYLLHHYFFVRWLLLVPLLVTLSSFINIINW